MIIGLGLNWIVLGHGGANFRQGGVRGIQGSACFWEVLQGVGLAQISLWGKWDIHPCCESCGMSQQGSTWLGIQLFCSCSGGQDPTRSSERIPSSLRGRGAGRRETQLLYLPLSSLLPSEQVLMFICLPALPLGPDGICRGPRFPFPQHKCSVYFVFPAQFLESLRVPGHSSPLLSSISSLVPVPWSSSSAGLALLLKIHQSIEMPIQNPAPVALCRVFLLLIPNSNPFGSCWVLVPCIPSVNRWRFVFQWQEIKSTSLVFYLLMAELKKYWFFICCCLKLGINLQEIFISMWLKYHLDRCSSPELFKLCHLLVLSTQLNHFVPIFVSKTSISPNTRQEWRWQGCVYLCKFMGILCLFFSLHGKQQLGISKIFFCWGQVCHGRLKQESQTCN